jgi:hypothetical protein
MRTVITKTICEENVKKMWPTTFSNKNIFFAETAWRRNLEKSQIPLHSRHAMGPGA